MHTKLRGETAVSGEGTATVLQPPVKYVSSEDAHESEKPSADEPMTPATVLLGG